MNLASIFERLNTIKTSFAALIQAHADHNEIDKTHLLNTLGSTIALLDHVLIPEEKPEEKEADHESESSAGKEGVTSESETVSEAAASAEAHPGSEIGQAASAVEDAAQPIVAAIQDADEAHALARLADDGHPLGDGE